MAVNDFKNEEGVTYSLSADQEVWNENESHATDNDNSLPVKCSEDCVDELVAECARFATVVDGESSDSLISVDADEDSEDMDVSPSAEKLDSETEKNFWKARSWLKYVYGLARASRLSPEGLLGAILVRVSALIPPFVVLKLTDWTEPMSLNLNIALIGATGTGKSSLISAASRLVPLPYENPMKELKPKTGESVVSKFAAMVQNKDEKGKPIPGQYHLRVLTDRVELVQTEIAALGASFKMDGSTMLSTLLQAFSNESIGAETRQKTSSVVLCPYSYRLSAILGVQPSEAHILFDNASVGFAGRFIFLMSTDASAPAMRPKKPEKRKIFDPTRFAEPSDFAGLTDLLVAGGLSNLADPDETYRLTELKFPPSIEEYVDKARMRGVRGEADELDAHRIELQAKVAALFSLFDSRGKGWEYRVTRRDWNLAGIFLLFSDRARDYCLSERSRLERQRRAQKIVDGELAKRIADADIAEAHSLETMDKVQRYLARCNSPVRGFDISRAINKKWRQDVYPTIDRLHEMGKVRLVKRADTTASSLWALADGR